MKRETILILCISVGLLLMAFFPHCLARNESLGFDFRCYWEAGRGNTAYAVNGSQPWLYPNKSEILFWPFSLLSFTWAFALYYAIAVVLYCVMIARLLECGKVGYVLAVFSAYPFLLAVESGNIAAWFGGFTLFWWGAALASVWKPYLVVLLFLNVLNRKKRWQVIALILLCGGILISSVLTMRQDIPDMAWRLLLQKKNLLLIPPVYLLFRPLMKEYEGTRPPPEFG